MKKIVKMESITQVHDLLGLPKPKHPLVSVIPIDKNMTQMDFGDYTYVLEFFQISLKSGIKGELTYGRNSYDFEEGSMIFMQPGQTLKVDSNEEMEEGSGWTLIFHPDLIAKSNLGNGIGDYSFFSYEVNESLHLSDDEKVTVTDLVNKIEREYNQNIDKHSQKLIISNIELILDYCTRYYDRQFYTRTNLNQDHITKFENLLKQYFKDGKQLEEGIPPISYFGDLMNMSPYYLSDLLKKETGIGASEHIHQYIINRAKISLLSTNDPISQIAYDLGFDYPQHFTKVFKKKIGMSPVEYRKSA